MTPTRDPVLGLVVVGVLTTGSSSTLMHLADSSASTTVVLRCTFALPFLLLVAARRDALRLPSDNRRAAGAGALLAVDLLLWDLAIDDLGAGLSTVVQDTHVVVVALIAWAVLGQRLGARTAAALPVLLLGVGLVGGLAGGSATGDAPVRGTLLALASAVAYAGFVVVLAQRTPGDAVPFLVVATVATAVTGAAAGAAVGSLDLTPGWTSAMWLLVLAVVTQVVGWLVLAQVLAGLPAVLASVLLLLQPVVALGYALVLLGEVPTLAQLLGVALVLASVAVVTGSTRHGHPATRAAPVLEAV